MLGWLLPLTTFWLLVALHDLRCVRRLRALPPRRGDENGANHDNGTGDSNAATGVSGDGDVRGVDDADRARDAEVTVVMAVRDDAAHVEHAVRHLLAQRHVALRLVVVDDRSADGTGAVLARLAAAEPRLTVHAVRELPPDWLGKTHALHVGAAGVATRWLLFTDGDAQLAPDTLARAIDAAERDDAQHVSLLPDHRGATFAGRACLLAFVLTVLRRVVAVNAPRQHSFVGTGAFNLVRTDAYRAVGGHVPLRMEVVDDVVLGGLLFAAGFRARCWLARRELTIEWGGTPRELVRVTTKNMFAVLRYRTWLAALAVVGGAGLVTAPLLMPWLAGALGWLPFAAWLASAVPAVALARRMGWPAAAGVVVPLARLLLPVALAHSTWTTLRHRGVRWRGTFYPLAQLRAGQVRLRRRTRAREGHHERGVQT